MSNASPPTFGLQIDGRDYQPRPGAYAIVIDSGRIAVIRSRTGTYFLPGGGIERGEAAVGALARELLEECGWTVRAATRVGDALQYVDAEHEGCFALHCSFFKVRTAIVPSPGVGNRSGETVEWISLQDVKHQLARECDGWAVAEALASPG